MADAAHHPEDRAREVRAGIGRSGCHGLDSAPIEYEGGDHAAGVRSGDPRCRALFALIGDDGGARAGHVDAATAAEGFGGRLDLVEQFVGVSVEWCCADGEFDGAVLDGRRRGILAGQWGVAGADAGRDAPAGLRDERHIALELENVAGFDNVVVGDLGVDDGQDHRHDDGQRENRQCRGDGAPIHAE